MTDRNKQFETLIKLIIQYDITNMRALIKLIESEDNTSDITNIKELHTVIVEQKQGLDFLQLLFEGNTQEIIRYNE